VLLGQHRERLVVDLLDDPGGVGQDAVTRCRGKWKGRTRADVLGVTPLETSRVSSAIRVTIDAARIDWAMWSM
jgi:hypothetical protein